MTRLKTTVRVWNRERGEFDYMEATIDVDPDKIAKAIGERAFKNKSKQSKAMRGGLILSIVTMPRT